MSLRLALPTAARWTIRQPGLDFFAQAQRGGQLCACDRHRLAPSPRAKPRSFIQWDYLALGRPRHLWRQPGDRVRHARRQASLPVSMFRRSAPMHRTPMQPNCGWSSSIRTTGSSSGSRATATRFATTIWWPAMSFPQDLADKLPAAEFYAQAVFPYAGSIERPHVNCHHPVGCRGQSRCQE